MKKPLSEAKFARECREELGCTRNRRRDSPELTPAEL